jgi:rRNA maturation endonuclease Nob1
LSVDGEILPIAFASLCCDTRISGFQIKCTECRERYPVRQLNELGYCDICSTADIESCNA